MDTHDDRINRGDKVVLTGMFRAGETEYELLENMQRVRDWITTKLNAQVVSATTENLAAGEPSPPVPAVVNQQAAHWIIVFGDGEFLYFPHGRRQPSPWLERLMEGGPVEPD